MVTPFYILFVYTRRYTMAITKTLDCKVEDGLSTIAENEPVKRKSIVELFEGYDGEYKPTEIEWGIPIGEEIW